MLYSSLCNVNFRASMRKAQYRVVGETRGVELAFSVSGHYMWLEWGVRTAGLLIVINYKGSVLLITFIFLQS